MHTEFLDPAVLVSSMFAAAVTYVVIYRAFPWDRRSVNKLGWDLYQEIIHPLLPANMTA